VFNSNVIKDAAGAVGGYSERWMRFVARMYVSLLKLRLDSNYYRPALLLNSSLGIDNS